MCIEDIAHCVAYASCGSPLHRGGRGGYGTSAADGAVGCRFGRVEGRDDVVQRGQDTARVAVARVRGRGRLCKVGNVVYGGRRCLLCGGAIGKEEVGGRVVGAVCCIRTTGPPCTQTALLIRTLLARKMSRAETVSTRASEETGLFIALGKTSAYAAARVIDSGALWGWSAATSSGLRRVTCK